MFPRREKIWKYFPLNILAIDHREALYLNQFLMHVRYTKRYLSLMEVLDFQRYRIIKKRALIDRILSLPLNKSDFLFPFNKN
jgi:hypothetical protein